MNGKTQRTEECTYDDGGEVVGVVLDDDVVGGGSEDVGGGVPDVEGDVSDVCDIPLPDPSPALEPPARRNNSNSYNKQTHRHSQNAFR
jgi:hypothetical protein